MNANPELPPGWAIARLRDIGTIVMGQSPPSSTYNNARLGIPFFQGKAEFSAVYPVPKVWCAKPGKVARLHDVLLSVRAPVGPTNLAPGDCCIGRGLAAITPESGLQLRYLLHALRYLAPQLDSRGTGTTFKAVSGAVVRDFTIPLAPSVEQARIAETLDELLSSLDAGVTALERARQKLDRYRASVLKAAVEGALTAEWRKQHLDVEPATKLLERILVERRRRWEEEQLRKFNEAGKEPPKNWKSKYREPAAHAGTELSFLPETWTWASVEQVGEVRLGRQRAPQHHSGPHMRPYLRVANVYEDRLDLSDVKTMNFTPEEFRTYALRPGDLLLNEGQSPELVGRPAMYRGEIEGCCYQKTLLRFRASHAVEPAFALLVFRAYLRNGRFRRSANITTSIGHLAAERLIVVEFPLPPLPEQREIVERTEHALSLVDHLDADVEAKLAGSRALRQAILQHAFSGKLVPQDPNDEPASELLKRIAADRAARATPVKTPRAKRPRKTMVSSS